MRIDTELIRNLCKSWVGAAANDEGSLQIGRSTEQVRLLNNGVKFHELDHEQMRAACIGLSSVLLHPGMNTVIDWDHQWFWSWCGELLCGVGSTYFREDECELKQLVALCCRGSLAGSSRPDEAGWEQKRVRSLNIEPNASQWIQGSHAAVAYLAFPMLEGLPKKLCSEFVSMNGVAVLPFGNKWRQYKPGQKCSSLRDLLLLFYAEVASDESRIDLDEQRLNLEVFAEGEEDGFDVLYRWRNSSLHGATSLPTIGGTVLNTAFLVALSGMGEDYESTKASTINSVRHEMQSLRHASASRSPWSYYPPYV